jgi:hypothetical protein
MTAKQKLRIDILVALFGDSEDKGIRDLSDSEKFFILNNSGVKAEVFACLKDFSHCLTPKNESWLNSFSLGVAEKLKVKVGDKLYVVREDGRGNVKVEDYTPIINKLKEVARILGLCSHT